MDSVFVRTDMIKCHRSGGNTHLFLTFWSLGSPKIKVLACLVPGEGLRPGLQTATFSSHPHVTERKRACSLPLRTPIPSGTVPLRLHPTLITSRRPHLQMPSHCGLELQHMTLGREINSVHIKLLSSSLPLGFPTHTLDLHKSIS